MFYNITDDSEESIIRRAIPLTPRPTHHNNKNTLATQSTTAPPPDYQYAQPYFHFQTPQLDTPSRPHSTAPPFPYIHASQSIPSSPCRTSIAARSAPPHVPPHQRFHCYKVVNNYYIGNAREHTRVQPGRNTIVDPQKFIAAQPSALDDFTEADFCANFDDDLSGTEAPSISVIQRPASLLHGLDFSRSSGKQLAVRGLDADILAEQDMLGTDEALLQAMGHRSTQMSSKRSLSVRRSGAIDFWRKEKYEYVRPEKEWPDDRSWQICLKESYWRQVFCCE